MNSATAPITTSLVNDKALDPCDVANPLAASFDPMENDIKNERIIVKNTHRSILYFTNKKFELN
jgi:hypothetical protein